MKLRDVHICVDCDELFERNKESLTQNCPKCTSTCVLPLTLWVTPIDERGPRVRATQPTNTEEKP